MVKKAQKTTTTATPKSSLQNRKPLLTITIKFFAIGLLLCCLIAWSDHEGWFNPDNTNNHTKRKWDAFYDFTKHNEVDVLLIGNSHLYTGINPKTLSSALGCNSFILASPGTEVVDYYYTLEEALAVQKPKVVVVETYGIVHNEQLKMTEGKLSDQFKSFVARKNKALKLKSTPYLFALKNYPYAWSNTLRNHDFLYTNYKQIKTNMNLKPYKRKKLYLGRYARFKTGIEDSVMAMYDSLSAPVNGKEFEVSDNTIKYTQKIIDLCESNNVPLVFLTLPMYEKHVAHYGEWKNTLSPLLGSYASEAWLDMQIAPYYEGFDRTSFENTYKHNQHMTYSGSLLASNKLVDYLKQKENIELPERRHNSKWRRMFYGDEGFFAYNSPSKTDSQNKILIPKNNADLIDEFMIQLGAESHSLRVKITPKSSAHFTELSTKKIKIHTTIKDLVGKIQHVVLELYYDPYHSNQSIVSYTIGILPVEVLSINDLKITD